MKDKFDMVAALLLMLMGGILLGVAATPEPQARQVHLICQPTKALAPEAQGLPANQITPAVYPFIYECVEK